MGRNEVCKLGLGFLTHAGRDEVCSRSTKKIGEEFSGGEFSYGGELSIGGYYLAGIFLGGGIFLVNWGEYSGRESLLGEIIR